AGSGKTVISKDRYKDWDPNKLEKMASSQAFFKEMMDAVNDMKETNGRVAAGLISVDSRMEEMANDLVFVMHRLNEMQGDIIDPEATLPGAPNNAEVTITPAPAAAPSGNITREALDSFKNQISRRDGELANKKLANLMEKMCLLREDYKSLCRNMGKNIGTFTAADVLESFQAYLIDMENMLSDAGVEIGPYGSDGDQVDVAHQRIVGVVPTNDPAKNGTVAARLADGYEYNGRALVKEKVNVYKAAEPAPKKSDEVMEILG
ncbi:MAG: hypothetical protein J5707_04745, partial [Candidatus Methanomethylophilus sp.]|nr:hypothetical protein [Methanomethylophilus sp.]